MNEQREPLPAVLPAVWIDGTKSLRDEIWALQRQRAQREAYSGELTVAESPIARAVSGLFGLRSLKPLALSGMVAVTAMKVACPEPVSPAPRLVPQFDMRGALNRAKAREREEAIETARLSELARKDAREASSTSARDLRTAVASNDCRASLHGLSRRGELPVATVPPLLESPCDRQSRRLNRLRELGGDYVLVGGEGRTSGPRGTLAKLIAEEKVAGRSMHDKTNVRKDLAAAVRRTPCSTPDD